jgi:hypothetical protein
MKITKIRKTKKKICRKLPQRQIGMAFAACEDSDPLEER